MRVALLSTHPQGQVGSMAIYGDLVLHALQSYAPQLDVKKVDLIATRRVDRNDARGRLQKLRLAFRARRQSSGVDADVYHVLDGSFAFMIGGIDWSRTVISVHDLIPALQVQGRFDVQPPGWAARRLIGVSLDSIRRAAVVAAVSESTARDVRELLGREDVHVVHNALRPLKVSRVLAATSAKGEQTILHVGNNAFYKNRAGVLEVFARMTSQHPALRLVMAGPAPDARLRSRAEAADVAGKVRWAVDPSDSELVGLYGRASLLLFPSLYEGFGWPPLEAMACNCPVICADTGALPEIVADAAIVRDPRDVGEFAAAALSLLDSPELARSLVERGRRNVLRFDEASMAARLAGHYEAVARHATQ